MIIRVISNNQDSNGQLAIKSIASFWLTYKTPAKGYNSHLKFAQELERKSFNT
jgi:hypothetical protein